MFIHQLIYILFIVSNDPFSLQSEKEEAVGVIRRHLIHPLRPRLMKLYFFIFAAVISGLPMLRLSDGATQNGRGSGMSSADILKAIQKLAYTEPSTETVF